jgi:transposase
MLSLPPSVRLFLATHPVDGRKGVDSLMVIVRDVFGQDPLSGHLFIFFSMRRDRVRIVYWDRNGFASWTKRLERGRFKPTFFEDNAMAANELAAAELALILDAIDVAGGRWRPRWEPSAKSNDLVPRS